MKTNENNPEDWYRSAKVRLGSADQLYPLEADQVDRRVVDAEPDTRKFQMDETTHLDSEMLQEMTDVVPESDASIGDSGSGTDSEETAGKSKRPEKKPPMKLPKPTTGPTTKNTKDAASETLKKYFGGR